MIIKWELKEIELKDIIVEKGNPKKEIPKGMSRLVKSFSEMGIVFGGIVDFDFRLVDGHSRLRAMQSQGVKSCSYFVPNRKLSDTEFRRARALYDIAKVGEVDLDIILDDDLLGIDFLEDIDFDIPDELIKLNGNEREKSPEDFTEQMESKNDDNCLLPIVPEFFENHECFVIVTHNDIDEGFIRDIFKLNGNYVSNSGDKKKRKTNVIDIENIRQWMMK